MKTRHDNDVIDRTGVVYIKNDTKICDLSNQVSIVMKTR